MACRYFCQVRNFIPKIWNFLTFPSPFSWLCQHICHGTNLEFVKEWIMKIPKNNVYTYRYPKYKLILPKDINFIQKNWKFWYFLSHCLGNANTFAMVSIWKRTLLLYFSSSVWEKKGSVILWTLLAKFMFSYCAAQTALFNTWHRSEMTFCYQNCSDLLWEKIVLVIEKNFCNSRLKAENLQNWVH